MKRKRDVYAALRRIALSSLLAVGLTSMTLPLLAPLQPATGQSFGERIRRLFDRRRSEGAASGRASGGAVRDATCMRNEDSALVASLPSSLGLRAIVRDDNYGTTDSPRPVFYFFTSYTDDIGDGSQGGFAQLMLIDESQYQLFDEPLIVELPENPGIVRVEIPESMPPLQPRRSYNWSFEIICDSTELSRNPFVTGWVERLSLDAPDDEPTWHEAVDELVETRRERKQEWLAFLEIYGLEALVDAPIVELTVVDAPRLPEESPDSESNQDFIDSLESSSGN